MRKQRKPKPNYKVNQGHIPTAPLTDEALKRLKDEREAYQAEHPKPWYL